MEILGLIISILALGFSSYTYITHDQKIKKQEKILNDYHINEIENNKMNSRKAIIEANTIKINAGKNAIKVYNKGQAIARNVNVLFESSEDIIIIGNPCPIDIKPQHSIEISILLSTGCPEKVKIGLEWDDDFNKNNLDYQYIQIL